MTETTGARVLEGTWDEIVANSNGNLSGKRVFILVLEGAGQTAHYTNGPSSMERERNSVEGFDMLPHLPISSEDFASREQKEIALEVNSRNIASSVSHVQTERIDPALIAGKYRHILSSTEEFVQRKQEEIALEERRWKK